MLVLTCEFSVDLKKTRIGMSMMIRDIKEKLET
jgi:hypothetical protein